MQTLYPDGITWKAKARAINGQTGTHAELVASIRAKGFDVDPDDEDKELSFIARPGVEKIGHRVIGEIRGGKKAAVRIMVKID